MQVGEQTHCGLAVTGVGEVPHPVWGISPNSYRRR